MRSVFEFLNYREYLHFWIDSQGAKAHGARGRMAKALAVSSTLISLILKGEKSLTPDQASDLTDHLVLTDLEAEYFQVLVDLDRAASVRYREKLEKRRARLEQQSRKIANRIPTFKELSDEQKAIFYSSWIFSGIRNLTATSAGSDVRALSERLGLEIQVVIRAVQFLLQHGLCREENGRLTYGPAALHVSKESPFVNKHHQNWRLQAIHNMEKQKAGDLFFTSPMSLSHAAAEEVGKLLPTMIQNVLKITGPSDSERVACLNIDWFQY
jgi:uncharacterized protein (TIGR02147 family)